MSNPVHLSETAHLPAWRRPEALLYLMAAAMPLSFATWSALLNNFVIEVAAFTGKEIGWLHTVREIPGLLAVVVIAILLAVREQVLALLMLALLGAATAVTGWFTSFSGLLVMTLLSSIGFHYFETVNQSLQLQWIDKGRAPVVLGRIVAVGAGASLAAYGAIVALWDAWGLDYNTVYMASGGLTMAIVLFAALAYPQFQSPHLQHRHMVLRRRYWLYYALQFMAGARRQIFVVFAGFMMVERFGMKVSEMTLLLLCNYLINMAVAPMMGRALGRYGERNVMGFDPGPAVLCAVLQPEDLFPEDCRPEGHCPHGRGGLHDQPYRGGLPAGGLGLSVGDLAGLRVHAGGGDGAGGLRAGLPHPAASRAGVGDGVLARAAGGSGVTVG